MSQPKDTRHTCQFCGSKTWMADMVAFMRDHDRPAGGRCLRAANVYSPTKSNPRAEAVKAAMVGTSGGRE